MRMGTSISVEEIGTCIPIVDLGPPSIDGHVLNSALPIRYYLELHRSCSYIDTINSRKRTAAVVTNIPQVLAQSLSGKSCKLA